MARRFPGSLIAPTPPTKNSSTASGMWSSQQQLQAVAASEWPYVILNDANFPNVVLLLTGDGTNGAQNNTFLDSSTNNFTVTRNGNSTQGTFSPYGSYWSNYFDGATDSLTIADDVSLQMGTGDFTMEAFVFSTVLQPTNAGLWGKGSSTTGFTVNVTSARVLVTIGSTSGVLTSTEGSVPVGVWTHIAFTRSGSTMYLFVNGALVSSATNATSLAVTEIFRIGTNRVASVDFAGYISNLRVVKGTALYTTNFTTPTAPLTAITNTSLLTCQSNRFIDNSSNNFAITRNGNTSIQRVSPFVYTTGYASNTIGGSAYFDGAGDYLSYGSNAAFTFGTGDFTVEAWIYLAAAADFNIFNVGGAAAGSYSLYWMSASSKFQSTRYGDTAGAGTTTNTYGVGQWLHVAAVRLGGTAKLYINGVADTGATYSMGSVTASAGESGRIWQGSALNSGYISNLRVVKGTAVYTANFTPPTAPVTNIANVSLLCDFINAGVIDNAMLNDLETVGNAQISTAQSRFNNSSINFDGTGDWLLLPHTADQMLGTSAFTIEMWVYRSSSGTYGLIGKGTATTGWLVSLNSSNQVVLTYASSTITSTGVVSATTWTHIAVVREGTGTNQTKIYISGVNDGTGTVATDFSQTNVMYVGADRIGGSAFNGYIDDLRITRGIARYTANFTPTASPFPTK